MSRGCQEGVKRVSRGCQEGVKNVPPSPKWRRGPCCGRAAWSPPAGRLGEYITDSRRAMRRRGSTAWRERSAARRGTRRTRSGAGSEQCPFGPGARGRIHWRPAARAVRLGPRTDVARRSRRSCSAARVPGAPARRFGDRGMMEIGLESRKALSPREPCHERSLIVRLAHCRTCLQRRCGAFAYMVLLRHPKEMWKPARKA